MTNNKFIKLVDSFYVTTSNYDYSKILIEQYKKYNVKI